MVIRLALHYTDVKGVEPSRLGFYWFILAIIVGFIAFAMFSDDKHAGADAGAGEVE